MMPQQLHERWTECAACLTSLESLIIYEEIVLEIDFSLGSDRESTYLKKIYELLVNFSGTD